ncbi:hypothetical protein [Pseudomonas sp. NPDC086278]|uniref:hypothetical protein n=1 Tax=Pseudomonas sp. NPDC086278 TaxID=3390646 RepID=UPI003CFEEE19
MTQTLNTMSAGTLDPTFGEGGILRNFPEISGYDMAAVLALPEKKLLVVIPLLGDDALFVVARLNENGTLDGTFGERQTGFVEVALKEARLAKVIGLRELNDGGWLILAEYQSTSSGDYGLLLVRQFANGRLDTSFGEEGSRYIPYKRLGGTEYQVVPQSAAERDEKSTFSSEPQIIRNSVNFAVQQSDNKIVLVSNVWDASGKAKGIVLRLNSNGSDDQTFNSSGFAIVELESIPNTANHGSVVAVQKDGKVLVGGYYSGASPSPRGAYLIRFDAAGHVDRSFNAGAVVTIPNDSLIDLAAISIRDSDGKIVVVGYAVRDSVINGLIAVLNDSGSPNLLFNGGKPLCSPVVSEGLRWWRCASPADGSIVVVGTTRLGANNAEHSAVTARYLPDGSLDPAFNGKGFTVFNEDEAFESAQDMAVMEDGRIIVCGIFSKDFELRGGWALRYLS